jgi:multicomponent Na+:H+ antiporter subunit B
MRRLVAVDPTRLLGLGLLLAAGSGVVALLLGQPFMTGQWWADVPGVGKAGTVLIFDVGVYLVVLGTTLLLLIGLMGEHE